MRQLNYIDTRNLEWHDVPQPSLVSDTAGLVRPLAMTTCDMDGGVISGIVRLRGPVPVGHEGVGEVVEIGDQVKKFRPGERVIIPWKISCGTCASCGRGFTAHCHSELAHRPPPGRSAYATAKNAQFGLVRSWARELAPFGITVDTVAPGSCPSSATRTSRRRSWTPTSRPCRPDASG
jgi:threonine dehydrogenase-like Zn-dependent dehydrogenase